MPNPHPSLSELNRPIWSVAGYSKRKELIVISGKLYVTAFRIAESLTKDARHQATVITDRAAERIKQ